MKCIRNSLNDFYATIKKYTGKFRFIFITGVARVSHVSIFSAFNNLLDISLDNDYNSLLGFTHNDITKYFDSYVENAANILKMSKNDVYARIEQYYDGFNFSFASEETLYNPWSIINFLTNPKKVFFNYWFKSAATSSIIINYLKIKNSFDFINYKDRDIIVYEDELSNIYEIDKIPQHILLYQAGYLTTCNNHDGTASLVFPNTEVEESLFRIYLTSNNLNPQSKLREKLNNLYIFIDNKNIIPLINIFNEILNECVSTSSKIFEDERSVHDLIYAVLIQIPSIQQIKERDTAKGRSDLELITAQTCMIIEFKRTYSTRGPEASLKKAIEQIKENRYGFLVSQTHSLYRVAMVISTEEKKILPDFCKEVI